MALVGVQAGASYLAREEVVAFVDEMVSKHQFQREKLEAVFGSAERRQNIIDAMDRPAEGMTWREYRKIFLTEERIREGVEFWRKHEKTLARAEETFSTPPKLLVAVVGVETYYGKIMGSHPVIDALSTLTFDYPRRSKFFRGQLEQFLLLVCEERVAPFDDDDSCQNEEGDAIAADVDIRDLVGSYAGAMGYGQFIPSSYRDFAIDFDGDDVRDIWTNPVDALGSVANYMAVHGWEGDGAPVERVVVPEPSEELSEHANASLEPSQTVEEWKRLGVQSNAEQSLQAALFRMEGGEGLEYYLGFQDFYVITRYNHSAMYALAVWQLAEEIEKAIQAG